jgi:hypothetical protein
MGSHFKVIIPLIVIAAVMLVSGCTTQQTPIKDLAPEDVAVNFWSDIDTGDYQNAFLLAYHADINASQKDWADERMARWGADGGNIKIYKFKVVDSYDENSSMFDVGGASLKVIDVNATIAYMGQNTTGPLKVILINTTDGWKIFGNY